MLDWSVTDAELAQVEAHHFRFDLDLIEFLAAIDPNNGADHLWHHYHVSQVRLDEIRFLVRLGGLFSFS